VEDSVDMKVDSVDSKVEWEDSKVLNSVDLRWNGRILRW